jgi:hypothetical protein
VTLSAEAFGVPEKQFLLFGSMGLVAVQAACLIEKGPVDLVFVQCLVHHAAVAGSAKLITCPLGLKRICGGCCFVALVALTIGHRGMDIGEEYSRSIRTMGVMAGRAIRFGYGIFNVLLGKSRSICLMTAHTEGGQFSLQKLIGFP